MSPTFWLESAWLPGVASTAGRTGTFDSTDALGRVVEDVLVGVEHGRITRLETGVRSVPPGTERLHGLTLPGMANCHSHAFHRALRGRTQRERGTFWSWREQMYSVAGRLTPDLYYDLAFATYREMLAAGFTSVGEFHYLHHGPDGTPYADPNAMGLAVVEAAHDAGIRIALLDTCYLTAGIGRPLEPAQRRFGDGDAEAWAGRVKGLEHLVDDRTVLGAAIHSVRAVPREQMRVVAAWAREQQAPLHVHLSEQVAENEACLAAYGQTPTAVLADAGALGERTSAVHATHLTDTDVALLGDSRTRACLCPTTERDLADGIGPSSLLRQAGATLTLGTDSHAVVDAFEEMRAVELDERLASRVRGHWSAAELLAAATYHGHASLGFPGAGRIAVGAPADLVTVDVRSPRTAGSPPGAEMLVFAASVADVTHVVVGGRAVTGRSEHRETGTQLHRAVSAVWKDPL